MRIFVTVEAVMDADNEIEATEQIYDTLTGTGLFDYFKISTEGEEE